MPPQTFEETGFVSPDFRLSATNSTQSSVILHDDFPVVIPPKTTFYSPHSVKSTSARLGLGLVVVPTLMVGAPKSSSYRNASDRAEEPKLCESSYVRKILKRAKARYPNSFRTYRGCGLKFFVVS